MWYVKMIFKKNIAFTYCHSLKEVVDKNMNDLHTKLERCCGS